MYVCVYIYIYIYIYIYTGKPPKCKCLGPGRLRKLTSAGARGQLSPSSSARCSPGTLQDSSKGGVVEIGCSDLYDVIY